MDITDAVDKAKATLDTFRDTLICDVKHTYDIEKQKLQHQHNQIRAFEKDVKNCSKVMTSITTGTRRQAFVTFEKMKSQLASHYHHLKAEFTNDVDVSLEVRVDTSLSSLGALNSLGKVDIQEAPSGKTLDAMTRVARHLDKLPYSSGERHDRPIDLMDSEVRLVKVVSRKDFGLEKVDLAGGTFIHDGRLLIADFSAKNHRLILFDHVFGVATTLPVSGQPTDVAFRVDESDIFVCLSEQKVINYSLGKGGNLIQKNELTTFKSVWNVAAFDTVLITGGDNYVCQMSMDGAKIDEIEMSDGPSLLGKHDLNRTYYYADRDSVVCRKIGGEEVFRHDTGRPVDGVAVDQEGNSYVVYKNEGKTGGVYQVSHDGQRARVLVEALSAVTDPYAVIFRQSKNMFVVTSDLEDTLFEVYEFIP
ncbi:hypothetical protein KP79_PYT13345 [Mizuhopecten yessoensis]|uniref:Tripartite motif-containing protein 2 n=1 Tax=Mizuhopecten yessoensis TaxID=6573 RepID=A0A210QR63_MIZYE|nr:hypothetical protein KP79_PYT13345 [Mizuhopecten yessoensis]